MEKKDTIDDAIFYHDYKELKCEINKYKKLEDVKDEAFRELPNYMYMKSLENMRMAFRIRSKFLNNFKINFKNSNKNNLTCEQCASGESETQCHALTCPGWEEHRSGLDLSSLEDKDRKKKEGG